jgi:hypothetical protein
MKEDEETSTFQLTCTDVRILQIINFPLSLKFDLQAIILIVGAISFYPILLFISYF